MKQIKLINLEDVSEQYVEKYWVRKAARAIVFDDDGLVALLHATKNHYYKLPGGGIEAGETNEEALKRECKEEIGCDIEIVSELGFTVEYRKKYNLNQTSYCYIVKLVGEKGVPNLEQDEIDEGFETVWFSIGDALKKVQQSDTIKYEAQYMVTRDIVLLETAINHIKDNFRIK
jgi:8-oxo-dGTP pyrophosphatase MutT (NUDIX family)